MTSPFNEGQARSAGFTLVEMLVVLAILSMAVAVSLPFAAGGGKGRGLQADARILAAMLRQARETALMTRRPATVLINLAPPGIADTDGKIVPFQAARRVTIVTAKGVSEDPRAAIVFEPNGGSTGGDIQLSGDGRSTRVQVDWLTGAISISGDQMRSRTGQEGFTLIETLVGFVILSAALIMSFAVLSDALRVTSHMAAQEAALREINGQIARLRLARQLTAGRSEGALPSGRWTLTIAPIAAGPQAGSMPVSAFRVKVRFIPANVAGEGRIMADTILLSGHGP